MTTTRRRKKSGVFFVDFPTIVAAAFIGLFLLVAVVLKSPPRIPTFGNFAVTAQWAGESPNDVDLYMRDPQGGICYFNHLSIDNLFLEHDDLGASSDSGYTLHGQHVNFERVIVRAIDAGQYVVNVHMYTQDDKAAPGPTQVKIVLWELRGQDHPKVTKVITLRHQGDQQTAMRFTLDSAGQVTNVNQLPADLFASTLKDSTPYSPQLPSGPSSPAAPPSVAEQRGRGGF